MGMIPNVTSVPVAPTDPREIPRKPKEEEKAQESLPKPVLDEYIPSKDVPRPIEDTPETEDPEKQTPGEKQASGEKAERCTGNTDKVDREIRKLKEKKAELEQQLRMETDETKTKELKKKLAQVEGELRQKDNDAYRRQHTVFS